MIVAGGTNKEALASLTSSCPVYCFLLKASQSGKHRRADEHVSVFFLTSKCRKRTLWCRRKAAGVLEAACALMLSPQRRFGLHSAETVAVQHVLSESALISEVLDL